MAAVGDPRFTAAYRALRADGSVQFDFEPVAPKPKLPGWVEMLGHWVDVAFRPLVWLIRWIAHLMPQAPYARILLWTVLVLLAAAILWMIVDRIRTGGWRLPRWRRARDIEVVAEEDWASEARSTTAWLQEAEALAAQGEYAEAIHHLLYRSVEDITRRRPRLIGPALTSRDIAANSGIPAGARAIFATIACAVERSLFGGRAVNAEDWASCRAAYADLALRATWSA